MSTIITALQSVASMEVAQERMAAFSSLAYEVGPQDDGELTLTYVVRLLGTARPIVPGDLSVRDGKNDSRPTLKHFHCSRHLDSVVEGRWQELANGTKSVHKARGALAVALGVDAPTLALLVERGARSRSKSGEALAAWAREAAKLLA
jgi:hypothetical protein